MRLGKSQSIMSPIAANLQAVRGRISEALQGARRTVTLVAVSKAQSPEAIRAAFDAGCGDFGENYLQDAIPKMNAVADLAITWHFIGHLQSNKAREVAERFDWVHSVDRAKIAERLAAARPVELAPLQLCIQVNIGGEDTKSGVAPGDVAALAHAVAELPRLRLRGLMAIPPASDDVRVQRRHFAALREIKERLNAGGFTLDTLSMGMSADLEAAIAEGATIVRIGTAIFGERHRR